MRRVSLYLLLISMQLFLSCEKSNVPVMSEWVGLRVKDSTPLEKEFRTDGKGKASIGWWAGGYTWPGGYFIIELVDVKSNKVILQQTYQYGDKATGNDEWPKFKWWHSEQQGRVDLKAKRIYKIKIHGQGLAQPGAGFGLWLYKIGEEEPKRQGGWQGIQ